MAIDLGDAVYQTGISVNANMAFHSKVPLVALLGLVHLRVMLAVFVLGGTGRSN
jgi:hypothetical protein